MDTLTKSQRMRAYAKKAKRMASAHERPNGHLWDIISYGEYLGDPLRAECVHCGQGHVSAYGGSAPPKGPCTPRQCLHLRAMWRRENNGQRFLVACADCKAVAVLLERTPEMSNGDLCTLMAQNLRSFMPSHRAREALAWDAPWILKL